LPSSWQKVVGDLEVKHAKMDRHLKAVEKNPMPKQTCKADEPFSQLGVRVRVLSLVFLQLSTVFRHLSSILWRRFPKVRIIAWHVCR